MKSGFIFKDLFLWAVVLSVLFCASCAKHIVRVEKETAVQKQERQGRLLARIGERDIFESEIMEAMECLPDDDRSFYLRGDAELARFVEKHVKEEVLLKKAAGRGESGHPENARGTGTSGRREIVEKYLSEEAGSRVTVTEEEMKQFYRGCIRVFSRPNRAKIKKIKTDSEEKAREIIVRLDAGEDFDTLAEKGSITDVVWEAADDWGYITGVGNSEEVAGAIFSLQPGDYTREPLKYREAYFVFQMIEIMPSQTTEFEHSREKVERVLRNMKESVEKKKIITEAMEEAEVEFFLQPLKGEWEKKKQYKDLIPAPSPVPVD